MLGTISLKLPLTREGSTTKELTKQRQRVNKVRKRQVKERDWQVNVQRVGGNNSFCDNYLWSILNWKEELKARDKDHRKQSELSTKLLIITPTQTIPNKMCSAKNMMISAVVLLAVFVISSNGAQFYTTPKIHPGKCRSSSSSCASPLLLFDVIAYRSRVILCRWMIICWPTRIFHGI